MAIGKRIASKNASALLGAAHKVARSMPALLQEARALAQSFMLGSLGQRKSGEGEGFWQFRPYIQGESLARIDWRRSARDQHIYLRERELGTVQTILLWVDQGYSMNYQSTHAPYTKADYATILCLILAELFAKSGAPVGLPALLPPTTSRKATEQVALALMKKEVRMHFSPLHKVKPGACFIMISDFLLNIDEIKAQLQPLYGQIVDAHFFHVVDPAERDFPFHGPTEFYHLETEESITLAQAQAYQKDYKCLYEDHSKSLKHFIESYGWHYETAPTDQALSALLLRFSQRLQNKQVVR